MLLVGAALGGVAAYVLTAPPPEPVSVPKVAGRPAAKPRPGAATPTHTENRVAPGVDLEGGSAPAEAARAAPGIGDDPAMRSRLEKEAELAAPRWAKVAPKLRDAQLRAEAAAMIERLRVMNEPSTILAHEQYALTQKLLTIGGYDRATQLEVDYLNSLAASVLQAGDAAEVITPEEAAVAKPKRPR